LIEERKENIGAIEQVSNVHIVQLISQEEE
jgi:uncharacterized membrane-anchored protein YhcB (DUF1043 family)